MMAALSLLRMRFLMGLQYRAAAAAGIMTQLFFGMIFIMVYVAFYTHSGAAQPMTLKEVVAYLWLQQMFLSLIMIWYADGELFELITRGNIAYELCRPWRLYPIWYAKLLAARLSSAALRCLPVACVVFFLPEPYRFSPPASPTALLLFAAALFAGLLLVVAISMFIYISVFWTMSPVGSLLVVSVAGDFLSGKIVPVPLMPDWMQTVAQLLPFRWTVDFPFRVYTGHIGVQEALAGMAAQVVWLAVLVAAGLWLMRRALRRVVVQGG